MASGMMRDMTQPPAAPIVTVYGIPNCDSVKKARKWLADHDVAPVFHDFKKSGIAPDHLSEWLASLGWERLLNRKGSTWRQLDEATQASVNDAASASALMLAHPSVVKRPVVKWPDGRLTVGFDAESFAAHLS